MKLLSKVKYKVSGLVAWW